MNLPLPIRVLLWPLSWLYGLAAQYKVLLYDRDVFEKKRLRTPVISVGNLTIGGTGKTPMVLYLAEKFLSMGKRVGILSRGYRGKRGTSDEIEMLKQRLGGRAEFGVGPDRYAEGQKIENEKPVDIFLLDDGFQHLKLARDIDIVMLDGSKKLKEQWVLPSGILREPISACSRADMLIVSRKYERPDIEANDSQEHLIFYAQTRLIGFREIGKKATPSYLSELGPRPYFGFCGVGNPDAFFEDLKRWHVNLAGTMKFRDHHSYSQTDIQRITDAARLAGAGVLVTTEKDEQNLLNVDFGEIQVYAAAIDFVLSSESEFDAALDRMLKERERPIA